MCKRFRGAAHVPCGRIGACAPYCTHNVSCQFFASLKTIKQILAARQRTLFKSDDGWVTADTPDLHFRVVTYTRAHKSTTVWGIRWFPPLMMCQNFLDSSDCIWIITNIALWEIANLFPWWTTWYVRSCWIASFKCNIGTQSGNLNLSCGSKTASWMRGSPGCWASLLNSNKSFAIRLRNWTKSWNENSSILKN